LAVVDFAAPPVDLAAPPVDFAAPVGFAPPVVLPAAPFTAASADLAPLAPFAVEPADRPGAAPTVGIRPIVGLVDFEPFSDGLPFPVEPATAESVVASLTAS
jgi:hypothetical protein